MPNCIQLIDRSTNKPAAFQDIDNAMRQHFNAPPDPDNWHRDWYNRFGLLLALGDDFTKIREIYEDMPEFLEIITWLEQHYEPKAWYQPK